MTPPDLSGKLRSSRALVFAVVGALSVLAVVGWLQFIGATSSGLLLSDARSLAGLPVSAGWLSDIGILIWLSSASVCLLVAMTLGVRDATGRYFLATAALTGWLVLDDALLLHESVLPTLFGIDQKAIYVGYVVAVLGWLVGYRRHHRDHLPLWLLIALGCFAASVLLDALPPKSRLPPEWHPLLEDGFKWLGIVVWSVRLWCVCLMEQSSIGSPRR